jgi:hypothetical protein
MTYSAHKFLCLRISSVLNNFQIHLVFLRSLRWLLFRASVVPISPILVTLMKEAVTFSETSVLKGHTV